MVILIYHIFTSVRYIFLKNTLFLILNKDLKKWYVGPSLFG